jgi:NADH dehydrogenase
MVTGAFGYSGKYIARRLLQAGLEVRTLTNTSADHSPFGNHVKAHPLCFSEPDRLAEALRGAAVLYNTYWVRFRRGKRFSHAAAVENTRILFEAARRANVRRVVHVSITNPDPHSELTYFSGKARLERALADLGMSYAILRPTVLFGREDILINNIAWLLRRFPVFGLFGDGSYRLQPIYVDDLAKLAVEMGRDVERDTIINAIGPQTFTYRELVQTIGGAIGRPRPMICLPPRLGWLAGKLVGWLKRDVTITWPEIQGLMQERLFVDGPPAGTTRLTDWVREHAVGLGASYANELARRDRNPVSALDKLARSETT